MLTDLKAKGIQRTRKRVNGLRKTLILDSYRVKRSNYGLNNPLDKQPAQTTPASSESVDMCRSVLDDTHWGLNPDILGEVSISLAI